MTNITKQPDGKWDRLYNWLKDINVFDEIKSFYGGLIDLVGFIIGQTSDQGADIVIRALPLVAPAPNAISLFYVSQSVLNFDKNQALAFAMCAEFVLFGLFETTLIMFDGYQDRPARYWWPLTISVSVSVIALLIIIFLVLALETDHAILAVLPVLSAAGATALALKRWHVRNQIAVMTARKLRPIRPAKMDNLDKKLDNILDKNSNHTPTEQENGQEELDKILDIYRDKPKASLRFVGKQLGRSPQTISNRLDELKSKGVVYVNGNGVEILSEE